MSETISQARLDELWDFADAPLSEQRFREEIGLVPARSVLAAELTTQLARSLGLQERYADANAVLDSIDRTDGVVLARTLLERGRLLNSSGHPEAAIPLFEEALAAASAVEQDFLAVDAAHMLAIADPGRAAHWTSRALETVDESADDRTKRWGVSLHNNAGWSLFSAGDFAAALAEFELAADAARDYGTDQQRQWAQEAIDETLAELKKQLP